MLCNWHNQRKRCHSKLGKVGTCESNDVQKGAQGSASHGNLRYMYKTGRKSHWKECWRKRLGGSSWQKAWHEHMLAAQNVNCILGCIRRRLATRAREFIVLLWRKAEGAEVVWIRNGDLIASLQYLKAAYQKERATFLHGLIVIRPEEDNFKVKERKFIFQAEISIERIERYWNRLPWWIADAISLEEFIQHQVMSLGKLT